MPKRLNVALVAFGIALNILAWIIPFGSLRYPSKDPTGVVTFIGQHIQSPDQLRYFWNGMLSLTIMTLLISFYEVWTKFEMSRD